MWKWLSSHGGGETRTTVPGNWSGNLLMKVKQLDYLVKIVICLNHGTVQNLISVKDLEAFFSEELIFSKFIFRSTAIYPGWLVYE